MRTDRRRNRSRENWVRDEATLAQSRNVLAKLVGGGGTSAEPATQADAATRRVSEPATIRRGISSRAVGALAVIASVVIGAVMWSAGYRPLRGRAPKSAGSRASRESRGVRDAATSQALVVPANGPPARKCHSDSALGVVPAIEYRDPPNTSSKCPQRPLEQCCASVVAMRRLTFRWISLARGPD